MHPKNISISGFRYDLPSERIAHYPLAERDNSKLLIYRDGRIGEDLYRHLGDHLPENALLVFNDTRVVEARIVFQKASGARIEIFCLEPPEEYGSITAAMLQTGKILWKCLIGGASKWKPGQVLSRTIDPGPLPAGNPESSPILLEARWVEKLDGCFLIEFSWSPPELNFAELLHRAGLIPLPPYIRRAAEEADQHSYQTVYARHDGSVAAPTAGLHFTETLLKNLEAKNIRKEFVTLHVGAGTFMPVKSERLAEHNMHAEYIVVRKTTLANLLAALGGRIIPVGTTSLRTIESLYWLGRKTILDPDILPEELVVRQWDPYTNRTPDLSPQEALQSLLRWMDRQELEQFFTKTQLLIAPGYEWKLTDGLITNFHQPESTLLLLIAALIGPAWKDIYRYALDHEFRFLSYGDGSLLFRSGAEYRGDGSIVL